MLYSQNLRRNTSSMDLVLVALILSGVVCLFQVLFFISVFYLFLKLRQVHQTVERISIIIAANKHSTDSPNVGVVSRIPLAPQPGETITVLRRGSGPVLPRQFVDPAFSHQNELREHSTTDNSVEHYNQGFHLDDNGMEHSLE